MVEANGFFINISKAVCIKYYNACNILRWQHFDTDKYRKNCFDIFDINSFQPFFHFQFIGFTNNIISLLWQHNADVFCFKIHLKSLVSLITCTSNLRKSTSIIFLSILWERKNRGRFFKLNYSYNQTQRMKWIHRMINCTMSFYSYFPFLHIHPFHIIHSTSSTLLSSSSSSEVCIMWYGENLCMST